MNGDAHDSPRPLKALVIEDSELAATLLLEQLKAGGYAPAARRVDNADGLTEALDLVRRERAKPAAEIIHVLLGDAHRFSEPGNPHQDDMTAVIVKL